MGKGKIAGVCMLDMSAAFDVVDHSILLEKLKLYGFDQEAIGWLKDYLSGRSQAVYIDGSLSSFLEVEVLSWVHFAMYCTPMNFLK